MAQQFINQLAVEVQPGSVDLASAIGQHPRPGNGKAIGLQPQLGKQFHVLAKAMIVIAGHLKVGGAWRMIEHIYNRRAFAIFVPGPFDLIGGGRSPPQKIFGEIVQSLINHAGSCCALFRLMMGSPKPTRPG
ncbi:hypothetical protein D3C78_1348020 [compost metagenome]